MTSLCTPLSNSLLREFTNVFKLHFQWLKFWNCTMPCSTDPNHSFTYFHFNIIKLFDMSWKILTLSAYFVCKRGHLSVKWKGVLGPVIYEWTSTLHRCKINFTLSLHPIGQDSFAQHHHPVHLSIGAAKRLTNGRLSWPKRSLYTHRRREHD